MRYGRHNHVGFQFTMTNDKRKLFHSGFITFGLFHMLSAPIFLTIIHLDIFDKNISAVISNIFCIIWSIGMFYIVIRIIAETCLSNIIKKIFKNVKGDFDYE